MANQDDRGPILAVQFRADEVWQVLRMVASWVKARDKALVWNVCVEEMSAKSDLDRWLATVYWRDLGEQGDGR